MTRWEYLWLEENDIIGHPRRRHQFRVLAPATDRRSPIVVTRKFPRPDGKKITLSYPLVKDWRKVRGAI